MSLDRIPLPRSEGQLVVCSLNDIAHDPDRVVSSTGAGLVVCLTERHELARRAPAYADWLRAHQPDRACWFPIQNDGSDTAASTMPLLELIVERLESGEVVVAHCAMGLGRAGTIATSTLILLGDAPDQALRTVATARPGAGPSSSAQWQFIDDIAHLRDRQP